MTKKFDTPVLLIVFSRADTATAVVRAVSKVKPSRVYVAADGPRAHKEGEAALCEETRKAVLAAIDWDCEVFTNFSDVNYGCGLGPANAVSWFFEHEEKGIILEDDCAPGSPSPYFSIPGKIV